MLKYFNLINSVPFHSHERSLIIESSIYLFQTVTHVIIIVTALLNKNNTTILNYTIRRYPMYGNPGVPTN